MLGLSPPQVTPEDEEWSAILNETTYSNTENKQAIKERWQDLVWIIILLIFEMVRPASQGQK